MKKLIYPIIAIFLLFNAFAVYYDFGTDTGEDQLYCGDNPVGSNYTCWQNFSISGQTETLITGGRFYLTQVVNNGTFIFVIRQIESNITNMVLGNDGLIAQSEVINTTTLIDGAYNNFTLTSNFEYTENTEYWLGIIVLTDNTYIQLEDDFTNIPNNSTDGYSLGMGYYSDNSTGDILPLELTSTEEYPAYTYGSDWTWSINLESPITETPTQSRHIPLVLIFLPSIFGVILFFKLRYDRSIKNLNFSMSEILVTIVMGLIASILLSYL